MQALLAATDVQALQAAVVPVKGSKHCVTTPATCPAVQTGFFTGATFTGSKPAAELGWQGGAASL